MSVVGVDFEPALRGCKPAIDDGMHGNSARAEPKCDRFLLGAITGVALYAD